MLDGHTAHRAGGGLCLLEILGTILAAAFVHAAQGILFGAQLCHCVLLEKMLVIMHSSKADVPMPCSNIRKPDSHASSSANFQIFMFHLRM